MIEIWDCHSLSIVLYFNNKNEDNPEEIIEAFHFRNQFNFPQNDDITKIDLPLYCIDEDELIESTFRLHWIVISFIRQHWNNILCTLFGCMQSFEYLYLGILTNIWVLIFTL